MNKFIFIPHPDAEYRYDYSFLADRMNELVERADTDDEAYRDFLGMIRHGCKTDLFFLMYFVLNIPEINTPWLIDRVYEVQDENNRTVDLWAREHWKSTIITFALTIQEILNNPEITIGIFSITAKVAIAFSRRIREEFEKNALLKAAFPDILHDKTPQRNWSDDAWTIQRTGNYNMATVEAYGLINTMPTGKHFSLRIYDDPINEDNVSTPDMMKKAEERFRSSTNVGRRGGKVRVVGTIYAFGDINHKLSQSKTWKVRIHSCYDENGNGVLMDKEELEERREDNGDFIFACQYLLDPRQLSEMQLSSEWLVYHDGVKYTGNNRFMVIDPAKTKTNRSDYTVMWVYEVDNRGNIIILDCVRDKLGLAETWSKMRGLVEKWDKVIKVGYGHTGAERDIEYYKECMSRDMFFFNIKPIKEKGAKISQVSPWTRIGSLQPHFKNGRIIFPKQIWYDDATGRRVNLIEAFINEEYLAFPTPVHDDMLDALAMIFSPEMKVGRTIKRDNVVDMPTYNPLAQLQKQKRNSSWMAM